ncbi:Isovaleryl-CoA dehydrogenase, mitochondrial [Altererythrobacter insulae]|nr:Isovaleryl-CoA dehydrogenase, mitochondrial [Altererythrobacter insulae]
MNFDLSEEQELFRSTVERFTASIDVEARRKLRDHEGGYDRSRWSELAELGLIALAASEETGGMGGSILDLALVGEAIGKANSPDPWLENGVLPARLLAAAGANDELEAVLTGESIVTLAWAERNQRYSMVAKQARADNGVISGEKTFVLNAPLSDHFVVTARDGDGTAFYLVPASADGLDIRSYRMADGSMAGELRFTRVSGKKLDIDATAQDQIVAELRLLAGAELVGLGQRLLDDTLVYVKEREQFGVPIGSFQALQHRLVDCYARIEQARSMLYRASLADASDAREWQRQAAGAKAHITANVDHIAREAVQMHGGMGITDELAIGHAMKRVMLLSKLFGDVDTNLVHYAEAA